MTQSGSGESLLSVLQAHKFFYPHAGAETSMFLTRDLLMRKGHKVLDFAMAHPRNEESSYSGYFSKRREFNPSEAGRLRRICDAASSVYSLDARRSVEKLLRDFRVDVAHLHLISHQLTMSVLDALKAAQVPVVMTLHDYKIACPAYTIYRDGSRCLDCTTQASALPAIKHRCIKGSLAGSMLGALESELSRIRGEWHKVDMFIAPSDFARTIAITAGIDPMRVVTLQNFIPDSEFPMERSPRPKAPQFFIASRLENLKGVDVLLEVFKDSNGKFGKLVIAGAGGENEPDVIAAAQESPWIDYRGRLTRSEVRAEFASATAAVVPSRWDENNPFGILEARAAGAPIIASAVGGLPELVDDGVDGILIAPGSRSDLERSLSRLASDWSLAEEFSRRSFERIRADNNEQRHYEALIHTYRKAVDSVKS